jgi:hypothetical protein
MVLSRKAKKNLLVPLATCGGCASTGTLGARAAVRRCNHACKWHGTVKRAFGNTSASRCVAPSRRAPRGRLLRVAFDAASFDGAGV